MTQKWKTDKEAIHFLFNEMFSAWSHGDGEAFANCFTEDVDYVTFFGQHLKGKKEVERSHQDLFNGVLKGSQMQGRITSIRFLNDELAIVHCIGNTKMSNQKNYNKKRESINTNVIAKQNGEWKISAFHNCRIKEPNFFIKWLLEKGKKKSEKS
ncbi:MULTISPECIES: SgcJ/EcaC family oxidoreductase [Niallia]|uniref:SgcJ/EcaC family oxidoreductase n=1 Tax=Niallia TaxID=2837506 RepID=UPI00203D9167|nr:SgcJ/EcaC family oxidoreductase [Niallia circulans]MCM2980000.1 SgcJ/EcaC family oxidoreductase [Niallia circulans]